MMQNSDGSQVLITQMEGNLTFKEGSDGGEGGSGNRSNKKEEMSKKVKNFFKKKNK